MCIPRRHCSRFGLRAGGGRDVDGGGGDEDAHVAAGGAKDRVVVPPVDAREVRPRPWRERRRPHVRLRLPRAASAAGRPLLRRRAAADAERGRLRVRRQTRAVHDRDPTPRPLRRRESAGREPPRRPPSLGYARLGNGRAAARRLRCWSQPDAAWRAAVPAASHLVGGQVVGRRAVYSLDHLLGTAAGG